MSPTTECPSFVVLFAFRESITNATAVLVLVLFVVAMAASGDRLAGVLAALSSGVWFDFFLTEPYQQFVIDDPNDVEAAVLLVLVGAAVTELALWGRRQQDRAGRRAGYLDGVLQTAEIAAGHEVPQDESISRVGQQIQTVLELDRCRYVPDPEFSQTRRGSLTTAPSRGAAFASTWNATAYPSTRRPTFLSALGE